MRFLSTVCLAAICMAVFRLLIPENKFQKQISLLIMCVFFLTSISAFGNIEINLDEDAFDLGVNTDYITFSEKVNGDIRKKICSDMENKVRDLLKEHEIYPDEIHIIVNISGLYSIDITQVKLVFSAEDRAAAEAAAEILAEELPAEITITTIVK